MTGAALERLGLCHNGIWQEESFYIEKEAYEQEASFIRKRVLYEAICKLAGSKKWNFFMNKILLQFFMFAESVQYKPVSCSTGFPLTGEKELSEQVGKITWKLCFFEKNVI